MKLNIITCMAAIGVALSALTACTSKNASEKDESVDMQRATAILNSMYTYYGAEGTSLLRENYPDDTDYRAGYLAGDDQNTASAEQHNPYSYLWPYSGSLSAISALYEATGDQQYVQMFDERALKGLDEYTDTTRMPMAYASYISSAPQSDRFYDDNIWIGIDLTDMFRSTGDTRYLKMSQNVWRFIESGTDSIMGGGIYWCEQKKHSKNTCSNAPGAVYALKLYEATGDMSYYNAGVDLYNWTKENLQDPEDGLYFDNKNLNGEIGKAKFSYNSGQMIQAASLLFKISGDSIYLDEARRVADASMKHFFNREASDANGTFNLLGNNDIWFMSVMVRGIAELASADGDTSRMDLIARNLDYAWEHARDNDTGLFNSDWSGEKTDERKWLLTQAAMSEMFARMASFKNTNTNKI